MEKSPTTALSRRQLLGGALAATGLAACDGGTSPMRPVITTPSEAIAELKAGNVRFNEGKQLVPTAADYERLWTTVAMSQMPFASILTCADSRLAPEIVFDQFLGDIFVVREAGNIAGGATNVGSLEYSQAVLGIKALCVIGHTSCGAVDAAFKNTRPGGNIDAIVDAIRPNIMGATTLDQAIIDNVKATIAQLRAQSAMLKSAEDAGKIVIVGGVYDIRNGEVTFLD